MGFDRELFERLVAEATATAMLLCLGCMCTYSEFRHPRTMLDIGMCFGLVILVAIHCFGALSGAHINPAVSVCACILGIIDWKMMLMYIAVQLLGAFCGFFLAMAVVPLNILKEEVGWSDGSFCVTVPMERLELWQAVLIEFCATVVLLFACCKIWDERNLDRNDSWSIRAGFTVVSLVYAAGTYTGCSLNFTRTLPPNLIQERFKHIWVYLVAHVLAAVVAPIVWRYILSGNELGEAINAASKDGKKDGDKPKKKDSGGKKDKKKDKKKDDDKEKEDKKDKKDKDDNKEEDEKKKRDKEKEKEDKEKEKEEQQKETRREREKRQKEQRQREKEREAEEKKERERKEKERKEEEKKEKERREKEEKEEEKREKERREKLEKEQKEREEREEEERKKKEEKRKRAIEQEKARN